MYHNFKAFFAYQLRKTSMKIDIANKTNPTTDVIECLITSTFISFLFFNTLNVTFKELTVNIINESTVKAECKNICLKINLLPDKNPILYITVDTAKEVEKPFASVFNTKKGAPTIEIPTIQYVINILIFFNSNFESNSDFVSSTVSWIAWKLSVNTFCGISFKTILKYIAPQIIPIKNVIHTKK